MFGVTIFNIPYGHPTYQVFVILVIHTTILEKQKSLLWLHSGIVYLNNLLHKLTLSSRSGSHEVGGGNFNRLG